MYSKEYVDEVARFDSILAEKFKNGGRIVHQAVWNSNDLSETREVTDQEIEKLEFMIHGN